MVRLPRLVVDPLPVTVVSHQPRPARRGSPPRLEVEEEEGEEREKVGNWTQGEKRGRGATGVECTPLPVLAQEDP